jgi:hypothetical protein
LTIQAYRCIIIQIEKPRHRGARIALAVQRDGFMVHYTTTNLRLPKEILKQLKLKAVEEGKSVSQLIREAIETYHFESKKPKKVEYRSDPLNKIIGMARSGIKDGSTAHDRYLYGNE